MNTSMTIKALSEIIEALRSGDKDLFSSEIRYLIDKDLLITSDDYLIELACSLYDEVILHDRYNVDFCLEIIEEIADILSLDDIEYIIEDLRDYGFSPYLICPNCNEINYLDEQEDRENMKCTECGNNI